MSGDEIDYSKAKFTKLPPGKAFGADDLSNWSKRRAMGRAGAGGSGASKGMKVSCLRCGFVNQVIQDRYARGHNLKACRQCGAGRRFLKIGNVTTGQRNRIERNGNRRSPQLSSPEPSRYRVQQSRTGWAVIDSKTGKAIADCATNSAAWSVADSLDRKSQTMDDTRDRIGRAYSGEG